MFCYRVANNCFYFSRNPSDVTVFTLTSYSKDMGIWETWKWVIDLPFQIQPLLSFFSMKIGNWKKKSSNNLIIRPVTCGFNLVTDDQKVLKNIAWEISQKYFMLMERKKVSLWRTFCLVPHLQLWYGALKRAVFIALCWDCEDRLTEDERSVGVKQGVIRRLMSCRDVLPSPFPETFRTKILSVMLLINRSDPSNISKLANSKIRIRGW